MRGANCFVAPTVHCMIQKMTLCVAMLNFKNQNDPIKRGSSNRAFFAAQEKRDRPRGRTHNKFFVVDYYY